MRAQQKLARHARPMGLEALLKRGLLIEYASLAWMIVEAIGAILAGVFAGSLALLAFGGDSIIELLSSFAVLGHLRLERKGKGSEDRTRRTEQATVVLLFLLIPIIGFGTIYAYLTGLKPESSVLGILIAAGAIVIMPVLSYEKQRVGKEAKCLPLMVDSKESVTCFLMSAALLVGLVANLLWRLWWVDYAATGVILIFLVRGAVESAREMRTETQRGAF